jgi:tripeptide aminopeptidase
MNVFTYDPTFLIERFTRYVQIDTEADPSSSTIPSSEKQKHLGSLLVKELQDIGVSHAHMDDFGYVYARIESNRSEPVPVICFCSHLDTSPDVKGRGVKPVIHRQYDGGDILFEDDPQLVLSAEEHPYLRNRIGDDIITASGTTLLGADDKAGIAIIMELAQYIQSHPEMPHGEIVLVFTPDEEIGRGVDAINMEKVGADFGYTLDGGERGSLEGESFSADALTIQFKGISAHPGYAKGKMVSAIKVASHFIDSLPRDKWCPEVTSGDEGFVHPLRMAGTVGHAEVEFILRDFETPMLDQYADQLRGLAMEAVAQFPGSGFDLQVRSQYRNMREVLEKQPQALELAKKAYQRAGLKPQLEKIRGGTDGSRLSFMGLPCPNIFTGEMAIHSCKEYVSVQDMQKAVECLYHIVTIAAEG